MRVEPKTLVYAATASAAEQWDECAPDDRTQKGDGPTEKEMSKRLENESMHEERGEGMASV